MGPIKQKHLASSASPETNQPKKQCQGGDVCFACKNTIDDDNECRYTTYVNGANYGLTVNVQS